MDIDEIKNTAEQSAVFCGRDSHFSSLFFNPLCLRSFSTG